MKKARILVVEDEGLVAAQIRETLEGLGYDVPAVAATGANAIERFAEIEPDLVLMDIQLKGGMSGIETARRMRARLDVPVVYLTAFSDTETLEEATADRPARLRAETVRRAEPARDHPDGALPARAHPRVARVGAVGVGRGVEHERRGA